jgi:phosphopantothenoylcysteine decarboxylase/phosphopantothenate--cysteine ligase
VNRLFPDGVSAVFDGVGKDTFLPSLECLDPFGTLVNFGNASGTPPPLDIRLLGNRGSQMVTRMGMGFFFRERRIQREAAEEIFDLMTKGILTARIERTYRLHDAAQAHRDLEGRRIIVTAGPTWEPIDPVRFIGNRSTGKMGFAIASEAFLRGAHVSLILGPGTLAPPAGVEVTNVETAQDMREAVLAAFDRADAVVMAAAVADFRPAETADSKLKKNLGPPSVGLTANPDILKELGERKDMQILVGFAAETTDVESSGRTKLETKGADVLIANEVGRPGTGFGSDTNRAAILAASGDDEPLRTWTKAELARVICDRIAKLLP